MLGQHRTGKANRYVVQKWVPCLGWREDWHRVRGFTRLSQAETYKATREKQHPGETLRIRDLRERKP